MNYFESALFLGSFFFPLHGLEFVMYAKELAPLLPLRSEPMQFVGKVFGPVLPWSCSQPGCPSQQT